MATLASVIQRGTRASQPAANTVSIGTLYCVTDESNKVERSNGTSWDAFSPAGGGDVSASGTLTSGKAIVGGGTTVVAASSLTAQFIGSSSGTQAAASMTTNRLLGRTTASSGAVEEITPGASISFVSGALNGRIVQVVNTETGAVATGTTTIPIDDTIPQNTEGDQYMSLAITPTNSSNKLRIDIAINITNSTNGTSLIVALFQDSVASAIAAFPVYVETGGAFRPVTFSHYMTAGTTSATIFKVRAGAQAGTTTFNGSAGSRFLGGIIASSITITEITV